ncbi:MAG TPA: hypothetical protein VI893_04425 [Thermoplasmata archaeon]|nr:hypothetical protein [Thermoplasmata archaeon]
MAKKVREWLVGLDEMDLNPYAEIVQRLVGEIPELAPVLDSHLSDEKGELLAYSLFARVADWLVRRHLENGREDPVVERALRFLESELVGGNPKEQELVAIGFVESLLDLQPPADGFCVLLGPVMTAELQRLRMFWSEVIRAKEEGRLD